MKNLEILDESEREMLLKFPAYLTLLAVNNHPALEEKKIEEATKISHVRTYASHPLLKEFYQEAEKVFEKNLAELDNKLPKGKEEREAAIDKDLAKLESILEKLGKHYGFIMHESLHSFKDHVSKAHMGVLESFIFPFPIKTKED